MAVEFDEVYFIQCFTTILGLLEIWNISGKFEEKKDYNNSA